MLEDTGYLIDSINETKLKDAIKLLIENKDLLLEFQNKSWNRYRYNQTTIVSKQDKFRDEIFKKYKVIN